MFILNSAALDSLLDYPSAISALEQAFAGPVPTPAEIPLRLQLDAGSGRLWVMPACAAGALGVKLVTQFEGNAARGLERIQATYLYLDPATGETLALLDGRALTARRTAAVSALATKRLANPGPATLALFGTGVQARAHLEAMRAVREIREVLVYGSTPEKSQAFAAACGGRAGAPGECYGANLICACTTSRGALWDGRCLRPGTHINAVGNSRDDSREVDEATVCRARVAVDTRPGVLAESGDLLLPIAAGVISAEHIVADLFELAAGKKKVRRSAEEITLFKSVGYALEDLVLARLAVGLAKSRPISYDE